MSLAAPCVPCCSTPVVTNTPGPPGPTGAAGAPFFTTVTVPFVVPAKPTNVTPLVLVQVASIAGMFAGQYLQIQNTAGGGNADIYQVFSVLPPGVTLPTGALDLIYLNAPSNQNVGVTCPQGSIVTASGALSNALNPANNLSDVASVITSLTNLGLNTGALTSYQVGGSTALGAVTTATPLNATVTLTATGTWLLFAHVRYDLAAASITTNTTTVSAKIRRTNNTPGDITGAIANLLVPASTTLTNSCAVMDTPPALYAGTLNDVLSICGYYAGAPTAGAINAVEAALVAVRLF